MKTTKNEIEFLRNELSRYKNLYNWKFQTDPVSACASAKEDARLYRKVGKKFVPVNDPYAYDGLRDGFWLIEIKNGCTSIRQQIFPDKAHLDGAVRRKEDELVNIIRAATEARPNKMPLSPEEKEDWEWFIKKHGDSFSTLSYPSFQESAEKIIKALLNEKD